MKERGSKWSENKKGLGKVEERRYYKRREQREGGKRIEQLEKERVSKQSVEE